MHRECRERFPRHRLQSKLLVNDPGMHHGTCITHVPWWMSGSLIFSRGKNVPGIPGPCTTGNFSYLARGPYTTSSLLGYGRTKEKGYQIQDTIANQINSIYGYNKIIFTIYSTHQSYHFFLSSGCKIFFGDGPSQIFCFMATILLQTCIHRADSRFCVDVGIWCKSHTRERGCAWWWRKDCE